MEFVPFTTADELPGLPEHWLAIFTKNTLAKSWTVTDYR